MDNPLLTPCTDYLNEIPKSEDEIKLLMNIPNVSNLLDYLTLFVHIFIYYLLLQLLGIIKDSLDGKYNINLSFRYIAFIY